MHRKMRVRVLFIPQDYWKWCEQKNDFCISQLRNLPIILPTNLLSMQKLKLQVPTHLNPPCEWFFLNDFVETYHWHVKTLWHLLPKGEIKQEAIWFVLVMQVGAIGQPCTLRCVPFPLFILVDDFILGSSHVSNTIPILYCLLIFTWGRKYQSNTNWMTDSSLVLSCWSTLTL